MPSYTHLRRAQPILAAHFFLAHAAAFRRDVGRFERAIEEADEMPLGSGAIAGTTYAVDTAFLADRLGFSRTVLNSLDASSDRDFVASFLYACSLSMVHLSRLAEDLIIFTSEEFGFFELPDRFATGSSLMPQKKNPDPLELARGKSGRVLGRLAGWLVTMKGLPGGYNRDLQEDKEAVFETEATLSSSLDACGAVAAGLTLNAARAEAAASGVLLATDVADYLVAKGVAFRDAHAIVGAIVRKLVAEGRDFASLSLEEWRVFSDRIGPDVGEAISAKASVAAKRTPQSTNPEAVRAALDELAGWIGKRRA
jgi:argininosuccinate lyase